MTAASVMSIIYTGLAVLILAVTLLPEIPTTWWPVRAMDVPRVQVLVLAVLLLVPAALLPARPWAGMALLSLAILWQGWKIWPYTPLATKEIRMAQPGDDQIKLMAWNVLMHNDDHQAAIAAIETESPDILLLMETDDRWARAMTPVLDGYATTVLHPKDNFFGMIFATRLPANDARVVYLTADETPTILAELVSPGGRAFRFVGLHPRPPGPGEDTDFRDRQILYAARFARQTDLPVISMGDFNAAAWSHPSHYFKTVGEFIDPRVGRGLIASFDARSRLLRCPIDQLYVSPDVAVVEFHRGPPSGSDHFPMTATVRIDPDLAAGLNRRPPKPDAETQKTMQEAFDSHAAWLAERHDARGVAPERRPEAVMAD